MNKKKSTAIIIAMIMSICMVSQVMAAMSLDWEMRVTIEDKYRERDLKYGDEWIAFGLARGGNVVSDTYYKSVITAVESDNFEPYASTCAKIILALTAMGKEVPDKLFDVLAQYDNAVQNVYISTVSYVLMAFDCKGYDIPQIADTENQNTRDKMLDCILAAQGENGLYGYEWDGVWYDDIDTTAIALQALVKYRDRVEVSAAIDKALAALKDVTVTSAEAYAQLSIAYIALGEEYDEEATVALWHMMDYYDNENGGFISAYSGEVNEMTTYQAYHALVALHKCTYERNLLYDMSDVYYSIEKSEEGYIIHSPFDMYALAIGKNGSDISAEAIWLIQGDRTYISDMPVLMLWSSFADMMPLCDAYKGE